MDEAELVTEQNGTTFYQDNVGYNTEETIPEPPPPLNEAIPEPPPVLDETSPEDAYIAPSAVTEPPPDEAPQAAEFSREDAYIAPSPVPEAPPDEVLQAAEVSPEYAHIAPSAVTEPAPDEVLQAVEVSLEPDVAAVTEAAAVESTGSPLHIYYNPDDYDNVHPTEPTADEPPYVAPYVEPELDPETGYRKSLPPPTIDMLVSDDNLPPPPSSPPPLDDPIEDTRVSVRDSYVSVGSPQEEELTVLHESNPVVINQDAPEQPQEHVEADHVITNPSRVTGFYDEVIPVDQNVVDTNDYSHIVENEIQVPDTVPPTTVNDVTVITDNNNTAKDVTWSTPGGAQVSMAGYSYATNEETIEMTDLAPATDKVNGGRLANALPGDDPEFYFRAKSPTNMDFFFALACIGFIINIIFGGIALYFVQKGRDSETARSAKKNGCIAVAMAVLGLLVTVGILLAVGFTRDPPWTLS